jgi:DNA-binding transcriptional ArsR family regulator
MEKFGKAIGNASRFRILEALFTGRKTVGELVRHVGLSQPAVSQHLKTLKEGELVRNERRGQEILYAVNSGHVLEMIRDLAFRLRKHLECCPEERGDSPIAPPDSPKGGAREPHRGVRGRTARGKARR